jgi:hypothetical protein
LQCEGEFFCKKELEIISLLAKEKQKTDKSFLFFEKRETEKLTTPATYFSFGKRETEK